jgi:hypothetical protein
MPRTALALAAAATLLAATPAARQALPERFSGFAINLNAGPSTARIEVEVSRWSTDEERAQLLNTLVEEQNAYRANEKMFGMLQKMPKAGFIRTDRTLAWDLRYARQHQLPDGGRALVLATDRPIGFREAVVQPRTMDYPFTIVEFRLNKENEGEGKILAGTRLLIDKNKNLVLENYGQQPVRFNEIRKIK